MALHAEELRSRFVAHQGKLNLQFRCRGWVEGTPENPWTEAFESWTQQIRNHVGDMIYDSMICSFSTTGVAERAASQIVMMDVFQRYFRFEVYCVCGIPGVTIEGTTADWQSIADRVATLDRFGLDWWLPHLRPICDHFVRTSRGDIDFDHWWNICKLKSEYGGDIINGWIAKMFPYLAVGHHGPCTRRNPIFETGEGFKTWSAPSGLSRVPFTWYNEVTERRRAMEAIGGLVGVSQDETTFALRPKVGWAVREVDKIELLLDRVVAEHRVFRGLREDAASRAKKDFFLRLPEDLERFHYRTNGARLFDTDGVAVYVILPDGLCDAIDWSHADASNKRVAARSWHRIAELADGTWLAINILPTRERPHQRVSATEIFQPQTTDPTPPFNPICVCSHDTLDKPGQNPVIALSFTEFLQRALASDGKLYWNDPVFAGYGDADQYTRRSKQQRK